MPRNKKSKNKIIISELYIDPKMKFRHLQRKIIALNLVFGMMRMAFLIFKHYQYEIKNMSDALQLYLYDTCNNCIFFVKTLELNDPYKLYTRGEWQKIKDTGIFSILTAKYNRIKKIFDKLGLSNDL